LAAKNYEALKQIKVKAFHYGDFDVKVQFNPVRLISGSAKIDPQSIRERKCFFVLQTDRQNNVACPLEKTI